MKYNPIEVYDLKVGDTFVENVDIQKQIIYEVLFVEDSDSVFDKIQYKSTNTGIIYYKNRYEVEKVLKCKLA